LVREIRLKKILLEAMLEAQDFGISIMVRRLQIVGVEGDRHYFVRIC
jgi:hypothetical protein